MKFKCPTCKEVFDRDMRSKLAKSCLTKKGFKSYCDKADRETFSRRLK